MKLSASRWAIAGLMLGALSLSVGCESTKPTTKEPAPAPVQAPAKVETSSAPPAGLVRSAAVFPTGKRESSVIQLERTMPAELSVGQEFNADIVITNLTGLTLSNVVVTDSGNGNFKLGSATPSAAKNDGQMAVWNLGNLGPNESKTIKVRGSATTVGQLQNCLTVDWDTQSCLTTNVIQPQLALTLEAPAEVLKCDPITLKYTVVNKGTGAARNVVINHPLPQGLVTENGMTALEAKVDVLEPNMPRTFGSVVKATQAGEFNNAAHAMADAGLKSTASAKTVVRQPVLTLTKTGTQTVFAGRPATFELTLSNTGDGEARDSFVEDTVPAGAKIVSIGQGGTATGNLVRWNLGTLKPGDSRKVSLTLESAVIGNLTNTALARAYCAADVSASAPVAVQGIPAVLLEVIDVSDPILVGDVETYVITVTNQGSAADTNIKIQAELEDTMEFVSAGGVTTGSFAGGKVTFAPLASLAPKAQAIWEVKVKAVKSGDVRFRVIMNTDQLTRPVEETEATNFYK